MEGRVNGSQAKAVKPNEAQQFQHFLVVPVEYFEKPAFSIAVLNIPSSCP